MTFKTHCELVKGPVDPAPMVDIVFLLLIFLVLSSPLVLQPGIGVLNPPVSNAPPAASFQGLVVTVTRDNLMFFNNQPVTPDSLGAALRAAVRQAPHNELIIKADRQVSHGAIVKLMSIAFESGVTAINLATRTELTPPAAPPAK